MRNQKRLNIEQLDRKIATFKVANKVIVPPKGWIHTIRTTLNMTLEQFGNRMNLSRQGANKVEEREATEAITLKSLKMAAAALDMQLVYGFVPKNGTIMDMIHQKAEEMARKIVLRTHHNMKLEHQENDERHIHKAIKELTDELLREIPKSLWD